METAEKLFERAKRLKPEELSRLLALLARHLSSDAGAKTSLAGKHQAELLALSGIADSNYTDVSSHKAAAEGSIGEASKDHSGEAEEGRQLFDEKSNLEKLAVKQGVKAVTDFDALLGDFWPEDESADDFIAQVRSWRRDDAPKRRL